MGDDKKVSLDFLTSEEIKLMIKISDQITNKSVFEEILKVVLTNFEGVYQDLNLAKSLNSTTSLSHNEIYTLASGLHSLTLLSFKNSMNRKEMWELLTELMMRDELISTVISAFYGERLLKKDLQPVIILNITLNNGENQTFQVSLKKFHEMRCLTASLLKEVITLERNKLQKVAN
ncbi:hypothetical protein HELRODRAFT_173534 [Helobdella robusta]|uniref:COMM domain-containing protein 5 n=1 Tax=Helobdella robusta TaxID=6412 RepID=T1F6Y4_HELRO|nr:hypothetical protein HELRODRAFT_173534 [Helobdella robusta]ESO03255.1 hypothetical protein HELRODRAFT_173534 [Helobdella robusta]